MPYDYDQSFEDQQQYGDRINISDALLAGGPDASKRVLLLLPLQSGGSSTNGTLTENLLDADQAGTLFGPIAKRAFGLFRRINTLGRVDAIAVGEPTGTSAYGTIAFSGAAEADGTVIANLAGYEVEFDVSEGDTAAEQAAALAAAITADTDCPWSGVQGTESSTHIVTCTLDYDGTLGNSARIAIENYDGVLAGYPTIVQPAHGATDPDITSYIATFAESAYRIVVNPWGIADNLAVCKAAAVDLEDSSTMQGAQFIHAFKGTAAEHLALIAGLDTWAIQVHNLRTGLQWMEMEIDAACIEAAYQSAQADPSVPFHQQERIGLSVEPGGVRPGRAEVEALVRAGAGQYTLDDDGVPYIHTCVTTCTHLTTGVASTAKSSPHVFYTAIEVRAFIRDRLRAINDTPAKKKLVDGKVGDIKGCVVDALQMLAGPDYQWLSKVALDAAIPDMVIARSATNLQRTAGGAPVPVIQDHRGTDLTLSLIRA